MFDGLQLVPTHRRHVTGQVGMPATGEPPCQVATILVLAPICFNIGLEPEIPPMSALETEDRAGAEPVERHRFKGLTRQTGRHVSGLWVG